MQQRVVIARALAMKMQVLMMDEPFGALDAPIRAEMQQLLLQLWSEEKNTILFITHDITKPCYCGQDYWAITSPGTYHSGHPGSILASALAEIDPGT